MSETLLELVKAVCAEVGVPAVSSVVGSNDPRALNMLALAKRELRELARSKFWPELVQFGTIPVVATVTSYPVPSDFGALAPATLFGDSDLAVQGALNPNQWASLQQYGSVYGIPGFRVLGGTFSILPAPVVSDTYRYEYKSKFPVVNGTTRKETFTSDDDKIVLDDGLFKMGLGWRYLKAKGMDYAEDFREYKEAVEQAYAQSLALGLQTIGRRRPYDEDVLTQGFVPDAGYGA